jgi:hypothetical protein
MFIQQAANHITNTIPTIAHRMPIIALIRLWWEGTAVPIILAMLPRPRTAMVVVVVCVDRVQCT